MTSEDARPLRIAVAGAGRTDAGLDAVAEEVGRRIAEAGAVLICGGLGGVMEAAARGCAEAGGLTIGILPGADADAANPHIRVPLPTGLGEARNTLVARTGDAVIAIGGRWGTLSEVALARKVGVPVVLLRPALTDRLELTVAESAKEAVQLALLAGGER
ncbi:MAG: TIGR00725 family protein [Longimicrobiales bacterium]|nr:TIGR00725 family protein [Longimicrobiales bacterium]